MFEKKKKKKQGQSEDLIAATGLVILLKLDSNRWIFFGLYDPGIWWMTLKIKGYLFYAIFKSCASFHSHRCIQTRVTSWKHQIWVQIRDYLSRVTLKFVRWLWKSKGLYFYAASGFVHHFITTSEFRLELQSGNAKFGTKSAIFCPVWPWNSTDDLEK